MYKGVYCALCKRMGKEYGLFSRMTLNYDFAFLAMLGLSMEETCAGFEKQRCFFNPFKKCMCCKSGEAFSFAGAASMIMLYYKLLDDIHDASFFRSLAVQLVIPYVSRKRKKAAKRFGELDEIMRVYIEEQTAVEDAGCKSIDQAAQPSARMLSRVAVLLSEEKRQRRVLERFGYCLGRWVYLVDAVDDLQKDIKSGNYNVFALSGDIKKEEDLGAVRKQSAGVLERTIVEAGAAFELLELKRFQPILGNVVFEGMPAVSRRVLNPETAK